MKTRQKILLTALSAALAVTMTSGLAITALADEAAKDHEFDAKSDVVFEDFDRADITDTVTASATGAETGEKPYLHVVYTAGKSATPGDAIYKQGSGSLAEVSTGGTITLRMRAPEGDVALSEIKFGVRGVDDDAAVLAKTLDELTDSEGSELPALSTTWQDYEISFATSYEDTDVFPTTTDSVASKPLLAIHLFAADATATGTLDIASVSYNKTGDVVMNDFRGGDTVDVTAKVADSGTWWSGSSEGYIVKRAIKLTAGGNFTVVKANAVGDYKYAIIETDGDTENLKVATTEDGTTWGEAAAYDGYSVALTGKEKGFKFSYDGTAEGGVTVRRIYLSNIVTRTPATAVPVIDASSAQALEDFSVAQSGISGVWEDMSTAPELAKAGLDYRLSYSNKNAAETKVEVKDGCLVFDATDLTSGGHGDYINFKFKSKKVVNGKYVVFKMKAEDGANLDTFRFKLGSPEDQYGSEVWSNAFKAAYGFNTPLLTEANPYKAGDWYYIVVDIEESGFETYEAGYSGMDLYLGGTGKLYIDAIFFAEKLPNVEQDFTATDVDFAGTELDYQYAGGFALNNKYGTATAFSFDITPKGDDFSPANLRLGLGSGTYWGSENQEGTLLTKDGKKLTELTYTKEAPTHVDIDIEASGIGAFDYVHVHTSDMGGFKLENVKLHTSTPKEDFKELSNTVLTLQDTFTANPTTDGYTYVGGASVTEGRYGKLEFTLTPGEGFNGEEFRVGLTKGEPSVKDIWIAQQGNTVITADGKVYSDIKFEKDTPVNFVFDLFALNADAPIDGFHVHSTGSKTGPFTVSNVKLTAVADNYAEELGKIPAHLDATPPQVAISTATTAKAGDEITVSYTATDDVTEAKDLTVTVSVTKDGEAVTLTGNKFKAAEGVYTVTVTARDANGNEGSATIQITVAAQQGGTEPGGTEPGGTEPGGTEPGGTEPGGTEPGGTTPGGTEPGGTEPGGTEPGGSDKDDGGLSTGAIVGIVIGVVAGVALICVIVLVVIKKKKH